MQTLNRVPESVLLLNAAGVIELANEPALALFDVDAGERDLNGTRLASLFDTHGAARIDLALARVLGDEPGNRLEEVRADLVTVPSRIINLSLARMRHRDGVCVVATPGGASAAPQPPLTPKVDGVSFVREQDQPARQQMRSDPPSQPPKAVTAPLSSHMPWNNHARRVALDEVERDQPQNTQSHKSLAASTRPAQDHLEKNARDVAADKADSANKNTHADVPAEMSSRASWKARRRDIYAEFESVKDERERNPDLPLISPAKCLSSAIGRHRGEAISESLLLVTDIDDREHHVRLDEDMLTGMFEHLVERIIAVSPPYCEARISLSLEGHEGFIVKFVDIGRGLSEQELEAVFRQPELALGISHTGLVEAQKAAASLDLGFSVNSGVASGTTVEITYDS
ncbi:hypothetical protein [Martelella soudanensis]|uniref:hypothetical protein n=1 Tax=unclassified Martelella TaxID=2629616 RepID=UPI0015DFDBC0|nr:MULTISPECIES: hypothetical protein [unclassified Martelella]